MTVGGHLAGGSNSIPGDSSNNQQQRVASIDATLEPGERNHIRAQEKRQNLIREVQKAVSGSQPNKESASRIKLIASDFQAIDNSSILDKSVDLILTEPPYSREWLPFHEPLGKLASRVLKEGGSFVMYAGHHSLPEVLDYIKKSGLNYWWEIAAKLNGPSRPAQHHQVYVMWRPLLWFVKGNRLRVLDCVPDLIESRPPNEEYTLEGEHVISKLTAQDDVVLDPLMGVGTTGITALRLKRRFIGIEKDQVTFALAKARIDMELSFHRTT